MDNEKIKITDGEVMETKLLQEKFQQKIFELGRLFLQKKQIETTSKILNEQETKTWDEWTNLQKMENELMERLLQKYGEGNLDLTKGEFIPGKKVTATS